MMKVAAAQIRVTGNPEENCEKILLFLERAKRRKVDIICFPETCLITKSKEVIPIEKFLKKIKDKCKTLRIYCIFGTYEKNGNNVYNIVYFIDKNGKVKYKYRKRHLWVTEKNVKAGKENKIVNTEFGKIGIITCWDFAFPEDIRKLSKSGARIIFCPSYLVNYKPAKDVLESLPLIRAFENCCYYVTCDTFTKETAGMSFICSPYKILGKIKGREGIISRKIDLKRIDKLRKFYDY